MKKIFELVVLLVLLVVFILIGRNKLAAFYYNRGCNYYKVNSYKDAIDYFNKSLKFNPSVSWTHYSLANAYDREKLEEKALEEYRIAIRLDKHFLWSYEALADMYLRKGSYQQGIDILKDAEVNIPDNQEIKDSLNLAFLKYSTYIINSGVEAYLSGKKSKGYELLNKALEINPDFSAAYYTLGHFYYIEHRYDEALYMLNEAIRLDEKFFVAHKLLGDIYFTKMIFNKAIDEYKEALSINPKDSVVLNNLGLAFMNLEDYPRAAEFLEKAVDLNPGKINFRYSLGSVYRDAGRPKDAVLEYEKIIQIQPDYPNVHNDLADIYKNEGLIKEASEEYQKEINFCNEKLLVLPNDPVLLNNISYAYNGIGQYVEAKIFIDKALALNPDYREGYLTLASIERNLGEYESALATLEKAKNLSRQRQIFIEQDAKGIKDELGTIAKGKIEFDMVYLKNGRHFKGVIVGQTEDRLTLEINIGTTTGKVTIFKDTIERIVSKK
ncbi:MAG: tetratricopeptide repeat protein [Candidatus Omnitrophica bacterium]|nr:tetratricopeptide repeat protein [Candidatus Omnitrophota bacterium]